MLSEATEGQLTYLGVGVLRWSFLSDSAYSSSRHRRRQTSRRSWGTALFCSGSIRYWASRTDRILSESSN